MATFLHKALLAAILPLVFCSGCFQPPTERQKAYQALARWEDQRSAPEDSLLAMIKSEDAHVRLRAVRSAGLIGQRSVQPAMITALDDPSQTVARQAAFSLGLMGAPTATAALEGILAIPGNPLRLAATLGLAHLPNQGTGLLKAVEDSDQEVAAAAWDGLRNVATKVDSTLLTEAIITGLSRNDPEVLWRVLRCAERHPAPDLIPYLAPHVQAPGAQVRIHAFRALAQQDSPRALAAVLQGSDQDQVSGNRHQRTMIAYCRALGALGNYGLGPISTLGPEDRRRLTEALIEGAGHANPHLAATALEAMEYIARGFELPPEAAQQESLLPVWRIRLARSANAQRQNEHPAVRAAAISSWAALRGIGSQTELQQLLAGNPPESDRVAILHALGLQVPAPIELLVDHALAPNQTVLVRVAALEALHPLGSAEADKTQVLDCLTQAAAAEDFVIAATALGFLDRFETRQSLVALAEAWDCSFPEGEAEVKRAILATLNSYGTKVLELRPPQLPAEIQDHLLTTTAQWLRQAFDSPDLRIRLEARQAALSTKLLPKILIPSEDSLRATMPAHHRDPAHPPVRLPFSGPKVLCETEKGGFVIQLDAKTAPNTCAAILDLIADGFFDQLTFHRVVPDFVVQGGDPRGDGWGGPGYTIRSEWSRIPFRRAMVGIAHDGKDTGGSQFFVTLSEQPHLNGRYTIFGEVVSGMDVVDELEMGDHFSLKIRP